MRPDDAQSRRAKWLTFWACFVGYAVCYFTRLSLSYTAPSLKQAMGWSGLAQLGQLSSIFPLAYGSSRFLGGILGDLMSPKKVFALGLFACGLLNVAFGLSSTLPMFALFWFLNGCFQGLVGPPCLKMITNWFDSKVRGFWWSVWHASNNVGGFLIPFLSGGLAEAFGWRYGMLGPGVLGILAAGTCLLLMQDGPEEPAKDVSQQTDATPEPLRAGSPTTPSDKTEIAKVSITEGVLADPVQWALGAAYLLIYVCRQGLAVWGIFFLLHSGAKSAAKAATLFSGFELGGFVGNLTAGFLSDLLLRKAKPGDPQSGQRVKVASAYFFAAMLLFPLLARCSGNLPILQYMLLFGLGHFLCGAQLLLPLVAAESAPKAWQTTATGFIGWVGYFGAAISGFPLSQVVHTFGWRGYFVVLTGAAALGTLLLLPLRNLRSWQERPDAPPARRALP